MSQLELGERLKEEGRDLVEANNLDFVERMRNVAIDLAHQNGIVTIDDLREHAAQHGLKPDHRNSWGTIFRGPEWRSVGFTKSRLASSHARIVRQWEHV